MTSLAPIIVFCYNRPEHLEQTLEALSRNELADQSTLYIYCDGPKEGASSEMRQKIAEVRQVARKRQWCKEVHIVEAEKNKGLANSIIDGVTDVVNRHGKVFVKANATLIGAIGAILEVNGFIQSIFAYNHGTHLIYFLIGVFFLFIACVFRLGIQMKEEQDLTI